MDLYTNSILELASTIPVTTRLKHPDVSVTKRTAICGSSITLDLNIADSKIREVGLDIKACALGQASACIFLTHAVGTNFDTILELRRNLKTFLETGTFLIKYPFARYKYFEPAQKVPYRHDSVLLVLDASIEALQKVSDLKTKSN
jgi:NifU-like protein involved in Fe-S cluster formation